MHLRTNNRSGLQSLDRSRGGAVVATRGGRGNNYPQTNSTNRKDSRLNYNSSSIPYLNKRGGDIGGMVGSYDATAKRPAGYDAVRLGNSRGGTSGLPSVK